MKKTLLLLVVLLVAFITWRSMMVAPTGEIEFRVMSFNVNTFHSEAGGRSRELVSSLLRHQQPQIVCLQEVVLESGGSSLEEFARTNGYPHYLVHEQYILGKGVGLAVLSHFPILRDTVFKVGLESDERYAQVMVLEIGDREVTVINTHFSNRDHWAVEGKIQALQQEYFSENLRTLQAQSVVRFLDSNWSDNDLLLLAGDLNTLPYSRAWRKLRSRLRGTASLRDMLQPTYKVEYQVHIDYIFSSKSLTKIDYQVLSTAASDHNPLLVTLGLANSH
jgi:endonuclease/exonuclease/phosphatase family metal-dependent hydrolase